MRLPTKIPHLIAVDSALLLQYLTANPDLYSALDFDVQVGQGRDPGDEFDPGIRSMAVQLSRRRIDCVAHADNVIHIIEVTQSAGLTALGQLHAYPKLYGLDFAPVKKLVPVLLTREIQSDMADSFRATGGLVIVLPE